MLTPFFLQQQVRKIQLFLKQLCDIKNWSDNAEKSALRFMLQEIFTYSSKHIKRNKSHLKIHKHYLFTSLII